MASRKTRARSREQGRSRPFIQLDPERWEEIAGIAVLILAVLTALGAFNLSDGFLLAPWVQFLQWALGWGVYLAPLVLFGLAVWLFLDALDKIVDIGWERPIALAALFLIALSLFHWIGAFDNPARKPGPFEGGGVVGWALMSQLIQAFGEAGALLALVAVAIIAVIVFFNVSLADLLQGGVTVVQTSAGTLGRFPQRLLRHLPRRLPRLIPGHQPQVQIRTAPAVRERPRPPLAAPSRLAPPPSSNNGEERAEPTNGDRRVEDVGTNGALRSASGTSAPSSLPVRIIGEKSALPPPPPPPEWHLPEWTEILEQSGEQEISRDEIRNRVRLIEETLSHFGLPAKVIEVNQGPTITQFGVEPGFVESRGADGKLHRIKVKVSRISSLQHDLELALAAAPLRIEAPVPGRSVVGIEVPNSQVAMVSLRSVIESEIFTNMKGKLRIALGQDVSGQPICADLTSMPHLLIAGATGSGKSVCINAIVGTLLCTMTPAQIRFIMIDPKRVELVNLNGIPHLLQPVVTEVDGAIAALQNVVREMDDRFRLFASKSARNIETYNQMVADKPEEQLPYHVIIVDELADLMMIAADQVEHAITRLAQMARATGIHLILATQRPSVDVVTGLIKANFPARISFAVTSQIDSRVILDSPGAEELLGRGDMLYMASDSSKLHRLQGCYVSDAEMERLVDYWKASGPPPESPNPARALPANGPRVNTGVQIPLGFEKTAEEDLLASAIEVVKKNNRASVSLLQRKLKIGYSRASRLMDQLEEQGIVGPDEGPSRGRAVLVQDKMPTPDSEEPPPPPEELSEDDFSDWTEDDWADLEKS